MPIAPGTRIGLYDVLAPLGAGGMGEVYRARDTRLGRDVALKILPSEFASADRLMRFEREARTLATLNHPHIAQIHGLEEEQGTRALVMELVEGEDLAQRIARGAIPVDEALAIARQVVEALEAAHEIGIVHRDLKPANIRLRPDGTVKVLDFGLAKSLEPVAPGGAGAEESSPTITSPALTMRGVILGTAAYMAPEQAKGKPVDKRADIWAFGCVLYEMLTGRRAFEGEGIAETIAAVVGREPDWRALPASVPGAVGTYLRRCLEKDHRQRVQAMGDIRLALTGAFDAPVPPSPTGATSSVIGSRLPWVASTLAALLALAFALPAIRHLSEPPPLELAETRLEISTPTTDNPTSFALSPDGRQMAIVASGGGPSQLWLRSLASTTLQPLAGTEGAVYPFWSPDGRSLGFFTGNALKRLDIGTSVAKTLAPVVGGRGGTWNQDGVIVFTAALGAPLLRVSAAGGETTAVTTLGPNQTTHLAPQFLPDGRRLLFYVLGSADTAGIYLSALDGGTPTRLMATESAGSYVSADAAGESGWLLWVRDGVLVAQKLDLARTSLVGEAVTVAEAVAVDASGSMRQSGVSVAMTGMLAYRTGTVGQRQLTWFDRSGTVRGLEGEPDGGGLIDPRVSPDGRRVAVGRTVQGNTDLWVVDGARTTRLTFDSALDQVPIWSPDGTRIAFRSNRTGQFDLFEKLTGGSGVEKGIAASDLTEAPTSWSPDGRLLLYHSTDPRTNTDLWLVPTTGDGRPSEFLKTSFREAHGVFSPDGRWVAYMSNESGRMEIYARPFVLPGAAPAGVAGPWQVSTAGGIHPAWSRDGKEIFYLNPAGAMVATPIAVTGAALAPGDPVVLFTTRIYGGGIDVQLGRQYDVAPNGRFLINTLLEGTAAPITVLMNWNPARASRP